MGTKYRTDDTMNMVKKEFQIVNPDMVQAVYKSVGDGDELYIKGIANSGLEDRVGDIVTEDALKSICEQATHCNLHLEHGRQIEDVIGTITEATLVEEGVQLVARIRNKFKQFMQELFDDGIKLGLSIAGLVEYEENNMSNIKAWDLTEVSLVAIPCDRNTMGTVTSKSITEQIQKLLEADKMAEEITQETIVNLINEAIAQVQEDVDAKFEEVKTSITELEAKINELATQEEETEEEEVVEEGLESEGEDKTLPETEIETGTEAKSFEEMLHTMQEDLKQEFNKSIEDNMLEFFSKAINLNPEARDPQFRSESHAPTEEATGDHVPTSKEVAEMIMKGEI
jgi:hypothetical protein